MAPSPDTPTNELMAIFQSEIDLYAGFARATGGQISPDEGKIVVDNDSRLFVGTRKGRIEVERLPSSAASRILGVWMSPNSDSKVQVEKLEEITKQWAERVRSSHIKIGNAWNYYQATIQKSLEYPLLATTISEKD
eukprot:2674723-Ditylum_brightwellii.AAC.1